MKQMDFVNAIFEAAKQRGYRVDVNRNGDRQISFEHKYLTDNDLRWLYQDICRKRGTYTRKDADKLLAGRPCAFAPFFELAGQIGVCRVEVVGRGKIYRSDLQQNAVGAAWMQPRGGGRI